MRKLILDFEYVWWFYRSMGIWKSEPQSSTGKCQISCDDGDQVVGVKVEEVTVIKVEEDPQPVKIEEVSVVKEDPEPTMFTEIQNESAVSCMYACVQCLCTAHRYPELPASLST
jgi:hypothetical protein